MWKWVSDLFEDNEFKDPSRRAFIQRRKFLTATAMAPFAIGSIDLTQPERMNRLEIFAMYSRYTVDDFKKCRILLHTNKGLLWGPPIIKVEIQHDPFFAQLTMEDFEIGIDLAEPYPKKWESRALRTFDVTGMQLIDKSGEALMGERVISPKVCLLAKDTLRLWYTLKENCSEPDRSNESIPSIFLEEERD